MWFKRHFLPSLVALPIYISLILNCFADRVDIVKEGMLVQQLMDQGKLDEALPHAKIVLYLLDKNDRQMADVYSAVVARTVTYTQTGQMRRSRSTEGP